MGDVTIELGVAKLGATSLAHAFRCLSMDAGGVVTVHATGVRTVVKTDPRTGRPSPWTDGFRAPHQA
jgi:acyl-CoA thioester hydrolase